MQVEPPGQDLPPDGAGEAPEPTDDRLRPLPLIAGAAAAVLALASAGHLVVLGALVALVASTRAGAVAALVATAAVLVRWGGPSLGAVAGGQAVLGPAIALGSAVAAVSSALAALAIVLLAPRQRTLVVALGIVAGAIAAGPELPHDIVVRIGGAVVATGMAFAARWVPFRQVAAAGVAVVALVLAAVA